MARGYTLEMAARSSHGTLEGPVRIGRSQRLLPEEPRSLTILRTYLPRRNGSLPCQPFDSNPLKAPSITPCRHLAGRRFIQHAPLPRGPRRITSSAFMLNTAEYLGTCRSRSTWELQEPLLFFLIRGSISTTPEL